MSLFNSFSLSKKRKKKTTESNDLLNASLSNAIVVMCGELRKKGKVNKAWKSRWCELAFHEEGITLSYYLSEINKTLCGAINIIDIYQLKVINYTENALDDYKLPDDIEQDTTANLSELDFSFMLCTLTREYILAAPNKRELNRWIETFHKYVHAHILHEGFLLLKREKTSNSWDKRYFQLNEFHQLKYYQHEADKQSYCGAIKLSEIAQIKIGKIYDNTHKFTLNFHSPKHRRKWVICCATEQEREEWQYMIQRIRPEEDDAKSSLHSPHDTDIGSVLSGSYTHHDRDAYSEISIDVTRDLGIIKCTSIKSCQALNNICAALNFFSVMVSKKLFSHDAHGLLIHYFERESGKTLLNDYHHLLTVHLSHNTESHKAFTEIYNKIRKFTACDFGQCVQYNRNTRLKEHQKMGRNDAKITYYIDIMDTIHCYCMHSYDIGYRLQNYVRNTNDYDTYWGAIRDVRSKNKPKNSGRFTIQFPHHSKASKIFKVGRRFNYWEEYDEFYVSPHFATLKAEIIAKISSAAYDFTRYKTQQYLDTDWAKRIKITLEQMLAVMVYIDYDIFARDMRTTFAGINIDNEPQWIQNIGEYAHLAKLLTEVVDGYGRNGINQVQSSIPSFYAALHHKHGIQNIPNIDLNHIILCGIHSTTSSIEVILSNNRGMIMELEYTNACTSSSDYSNEHEESQWPSWQNTNYFETSFLSSKGYENEIIFTNTFSPLSVPKIRILDEKHIYWINCKPFIGALAVFKMIINGADKAKLKHAQRYIQILLALLQNNDPAPQIINKTLQLIKDKTTQIILDIAMIKSEKEISEFFMSNETENILKYNVINALFPNATRITAKRKHHRIALSESFFEAIYQAMDAINTQFEQIVVMKPDIKCDLNQFEDKFNEKQWSIYNNAKTLCITRKGALMDEDDDDEASDLSTDSSFSQMQRNSVPIMEDEEEDDPQLERKAEQNQSKKSNTKQLEKKTGKSKSKKNETTKEKSPKAKSKSAKGSPTAKSSDVKPIKKSQSYDMRKETISPRMKPKTPRRPKTPKLKPRGVRPPPPPRPNTMEEIKEEQVVTPTVTKDETVSLKDGHSDNSRKMKKRSKSTKNLLDKDNNEKRKKKNKKKSNDEEPQTHRRSLTQKLQKQSSNTESNPDNAQKAVTKSKQLKKSKKKKKKNTEPKRKHRRSHTDAYKKQTKDKDEKKKKEKSKHKNKTNDESHPHRRLRSSSYGTNSVDKSERNKLKTKESKSPKLKKIKNDKQKMEKGKKRKKHTIKQASAKEKIGKLKLQRASSANDPKKGKSKSVSTLNYKHKGTLTPQPNRKKKKKKGKKSDAK